MAVNLLFPSAVYIAGINAFSVGLFYYDKLQAQNKGWRVPEKQLQFTALLGGWVGGIWAMNKFRHKTVKQEFRTPYFIATGINMLGMGLIAGGVMTSPKLRRRLEREYSKLIIK
jgi:uncharacterized membrane protein YsdA (DUF1294 family)